VVIGNIYFVDVFLGGEFSTYGIRVMNFLEADPENRIDPMAVVFPRVTKCSFYKVSFFEKFQIYVSIWVFGIFFLLDFGLSWLTSLQFIQYHVAGFYKPTVPQSPPSHLQDYSTCNNARIEFSTIFVPSFDPNEWCLKKWYP
jgi:hypothetical protein